MTGIHWLENRSIRFCHTSGHVAARNKSNRTIKSCRRIMVHLEAKVTNFVNSAKELRQLAPQSPKKFTPKSVNNSSRLCSKAQHRRKSVCVKWKDRSIENNRWNAIVKQTFKKRIRSTWIGLKFGSIQTRRIYPCSMTVFASSQIKRSRSKSQI